MRNRYVTESSHLEGIGSEGRKGTSFGRPFLRTCFTKFQRKEKGFELIIKELEDKIKRAKIKQKSLVEEDKQLSQILNQIENSESLRKLFIYSLLKFKAILPIYDEKWLEFFVNCIIEGFSKTDLGACGSLVEMISMKDAKLQFLKQSIQPIQK